MRKKRMIALVLSLMMIVAMVAGCAVQTTEEPVAGGAEEASNGSKNSRDDVVIYVEQVFFNLNPFETVSYVNMYLFNQVYEALTIIDDESNVNPCLATDWTMSDDVSIYTFNLRKGVKFHNGEEMKASDVVFTYNKAMESAALNSYTSSIESVTALDDYTVEIKLKQPSVSFINNSAEIYIVSEKFYNEVAGNLQEQCCGTGPYMPEDVNLNVEIKLKAFPDYWQGEAEIKTAVMRCITDSTTAVVAFEAGELDFMQVYNTSSYQPLADTGLYNTALKTTMHTAFITMNNEVAPFDNKLVRQALTYAMDKDAMIQVAYEGLAQPARMQAAESCFGVNFADCPDYSYDLEKAKSLLAEAGYPNGINFKDDFNIVMDVIGGSYHEKLAQVFQQSLAEIGVVLELRASETYSEDCATGNFAISNQGQTFTSDMSYLVSQYGTSGIGSKNYSRFSNARVDELFALADQETDQEQRKVYYKEICEIVTDECPSLCAFHKQIPYVWAKDLNANPHLSSPHPYYIYEWSWK